MQIQKTGKINSEEITLDVETINKNETEVEVVVELRMFLCGEGTCSVEERKVSISLKLEENGPSTEVLEVKF